jgi:hypothetical protein
MIYSGACFLFWAKHGADRIVLLYKGDMHATILRYISKYPLFSLLDVIDGAMDESYLLMTEYKSIKEIPNKHWLRTGKMYVPCILIEVEYVIMQTLIKNDKHDKYTTLLLDGIFPYMYEPTPLEETYKHTDFYRDLYVNKLPYRTMDSNVLIDNQVAKILFKVYNTIMYVL